MDYAFLFSRNISDKCVITNENEELILNDTATFFILLQTILAMTLLKRRKKMKM